MRVQSLRSLSARHVIWHFVILSILLSGAVSVAQALGPWMNGQAANLVLGQPDFTTGDSGHSATTMSVPYSIAVDPTTGKVFVADSSNNRVLRFAAGNALANGAAAEAVLGEPDLTTKTGGTTQSTMDYPSGVFVDSGGRLWVGDSGNSRVLRFDNASSKATGANADGVLGHSTFETGSFGIGAARLNWPRGVAVDSAGRLWVADQGNNRILRFDSAATKSDGASADGVLGEPNFTTSSIATSQDRMYYPMGLAVTSSGTLFVADKGNWRVLRFDNAAAKSDGANADGVLGQANFTSRTAATTANGMMETWSVSVDGEGRLYVADTDNCRILIFNNAAVLPDGASADYVWGQTSFTSNMCDVSKSALNSPFGVFADDAAHAVWVADESNNRVLRFVPLSTNANLSNLALSSGTLNPPFASGTLTYTASVATNVTSITLTPTTADGNATVTVNGTPVVSGNPSGAIGLALGDNTITTIVTAQDGTTTKTYTVTLTRSPFNDVYLPLVIR